MLCPILTTWGSFLKFIKCRLQSPEKLSSNLNSVTDQLLILGKGLCQSDRKKSEWHKKGMSGWVLAHKKSSMNICWMNEWGSLKHHLLYEAFQDHSRSQGCILCATFHRIMSEFTCLTTNYLSLGNILTHFCDFHFVLPYVLPPPFYLKSKY